MELTNLDSPSMHFAIGMLLTGLLCLPVLLWRPRWWHYVPVLQTLGGIFALVPDFGLIPSFFPSVLPAVEADAAKGLFDGALGNLFFFHAAIDQSGEGSFLRGFIWVTVQYNFWILAFIASRHLSGRGTVRFAVPRAAANHQVPARSAPAVAPVTGQPASGDTAHVDQHRGVLVLPGGSQSTTGLELRTDALASFSILFNDEVIYRVDRPAGCGANQAASLRELEAKLSELEKLPMGPESRRSIDLRLIDQYGQCQDVNLYLRKGNYRYSKHSYRQSTAHLVELCGSLCKAFAAGGAPVS